MNMPSHVVSEEKFPKVYGWVSRFQTAVDSSASTTPKPRVMTGDEAVSYVESFRDEEGTAQEVVDEDDPQGFAQGTHVEVYPTDWGSSHRDSGRLVALAPDEVTIRVEEGAEGLRIHAPRTGFRVSRVTAAGA